MLNDEEKKIINKFASDILRQAGGNFPPAFLEQMKEMLQFKLALNEESDRGCALMAASFIDIRIKQLIEKQFIKDKCTNELLASSGPIGTFSNRINIAFSLALIPAGMRRDLHILRKIRNDFAHDSSPISFETHHIKSRCFELKYAGKERRNLTARDCFNHAMLAIDGSICVSIIETPKKKAILDVDFEKRENMYSELQDRIKF